MRRRFRPQLEALESIMVLSGTVTAIQAQLVEPIIHVLALTTVIGVGARAENLVFINEHVHFANQVQKVKRTPEQGGSVSLQTTQVELAAPTVNLNMLASASGTDALAINIVIVDINIRFAKQSQMVTRGGSPAIITDTVSQTEFDDPVVNVSESSIASGAHEVAINKIVVHINIVMAPQIDSVISTGYGRLSSARESLQLVDPVLIVSPDVIIGHVRWR
jgi:hypothetical protein